MHGDASGGTSSFQELAPQSITWTNKWITWLGDLGEGPGSEREGGNTYPFGCAVLEEVEGARHSDDTSIAERRSKHECACVID